MKRVASSLQTLRILPDEMTRRAIDRLEEARTAVREIAEIRAREKMSSTRASHAAREIGEIIKILSLYLPNEQ
jgi:hypothetical protein